MTQSLSRSLTHCLSLTHSLTHSLHSLTHSLNNPLTHAYVNARSFFTNTYASTSQSSLNYNTCIYLYSFLLIGSLSYSELGTLIPKSGGEYSYFAEATIPIIAYLFAWTRTLILQPSAVAIICMTFASYAVSFFDLCGPYQPPEKLVAILAICKSISKPRHDKPHL